jgi:hypothetical protein
LRSLAPDLWKRPAGGRSGSQDLSGREKIRNR